MMRHRNSENHGLSNTTDYDDLSAFEIDDDTLSTESESSGDQQPIIPKRTAAWKRPFRSRDARSSLPTHSSSSDTISTLSQSPKEDVDDDSTTFRNIEHSGKKSFCYSCLHTTRNCRHKRAARGKAKARNPE